MIANPPVTRASSSAVRAKYLIFTLIGLVTAYVLVHNERFLIDRAHPLWTHFEPVKWWLYPHAFAGLCTVVVAPLQFSDRLRRNFPKYHRVMGRVYVAGIFALAPLGAYIQYLQETTHGLTRSFTILAVTNMVLLIIPTAMAFYFARQRQIMLHRQWMVRSYAVALVFFEGRFILGVTGWESNPALIEPVIWTCLALSLLIADVIIHVHDRRRPA